MELNSKILDIRNEKQRRFKLSNRVTQKRINPLNDGLNPICHLLALLGGHHIFHVRGLRVNQYF